MILNKTNCKRLGIFIFYDKDSYVDDYVLYMLKSLSDAVDKVIIVSNSYLSPSEKTKFYEFTNDIYVRENLGLDAGAFKFIYEKLGKSYFCDYDELILLNDTFYGPFIPFKNVIKEMGQRDIDFWGLSRSYECFDEYRCMKDGYIHSHIQTFFICFRNNVLKSEVFDDYWKKYDVSKMNTFFDVVTKHELEFTNYLEKNGFAWDTYVDASFYKSDNRKNNFNIYGYSSYQLLKYFNSPFLKRKNLIFDKNDSLYLTDGTDASSSIEYIIKNFDYDVDMILKNIIRIYNIADIYQGLNFNYIVEECNKSAQKNLIIVNIQSLKYINLIQTYLDSIKCSDIMMISSDENITSAYDKINLCKSFYSFLCSKKMEYVEKYDNICVINIPKESESILTIDQAQLFRNIENTILNDRYIFGINKLFSDNKRLGVLLTNSAFHNKYILNINGVVWEEMYKKIKKLNLNIAADKFIPCSSDSAWFKSEVLLNLPDNDLSVNEFVYLLPYIAQKNILYTGKLYNKKYLCNDIVCLEKITKKILPNKNISYPNRLPISGGNDDKLIVKMRRIIPFKIRRKILNMVKK